MVGIPHYEPYGTTCGFAFEYTAEEFHFVCFIATCRYVVLSGAASVDFALYEIHVYANAGRVAVNNSAYGRSVAFAECRECEYVAECVVHKVVEFRIMFVGLSPSLGYMA